MDAHAKVDTSALEAELKKIAKKVQDFRPAWPAVDRFTSRVYRLQFASEGSHLGTPWAKLKPKTVKYRARPGGNRGGILRDTNRLWASYTKPRSPEGVTRFEPQEYERGSAMPYAIFHQVGTKRGLPARPMFPDPLPEKVQAVYLGLIVKHLEDV